MNDRWHAELRTTGGGESVLPDRVICRSCKWRAYPHLMHRDDQELLKQRQRDGLSLDEVVNCEPCERARWTIKNRDYRATAMSVPTVATPAYVELPSHQAATVRSTPRQPAKLIYVRCRDCRILRLPGDYKGAVKVDLVAAHYRGEKVDYRFRCGKCEERRAHKAELDLREAAEAQERHADQQAREHAAKEKGTNVMPFTLSIAERNKIRRNRAGKLKPTTITRTGKGRYTVEGSMGRYGVAERYRVDLHPTGTYPNGFCSCPDFQYRALEKGLQCKHIQQCILWYGLEDADWPENEAASSVQAGQAVRINTAGKVEAAVPPKPVESPKVLGTLVLPIDADAVVKWIDFVKAFSAGYTRFEIRVGESKSRLGGMWNTQTEISLVGYAD